MNQITLKYLMDLVNHLEYYNTMAPFPVYDTEYVKAVKQKIMDIQNEDKTDYDEEPVVACKYCYNLATVVDELDNDICMRCGSVNELKTFGTIHEYKKFIDGER